MGSKQVWQGFPGRLHARALLAVLQHRRSNHTRAEVYRVLSRDELQLEVSRQQRRVSRSSGLLLLVLLAQGKLLISQNLTSQERWNTILWIVLFLGIGVYILFEVIKAFCAVMDCRKGIERRARCGYRRGEERRCGEGSVDSHRCVRGEGVWEQSTTRREDQGRCL